MKNHNHNPDYLKHNTAQLVRGGIEYFDLLEKMMDEAEESIHLQTYIFDEDETGTRVANALIRAAERNVKVHVLLDGYGSQSLSKEFIKRLTDSGIFFRRFQPLFKSKRFYMGRRLHHKIVVVDSFKCTVAGLNISNRYNDTPEESAWLDWALYAEGDVAPVLEDICKGRMRLKHKTENQSKPKHKTQEVCPIRVRVNDRFGRKRQIYDSYLEMFRESKDHLIIMSSYFLPGREFRRNITAAVKRGVKIKVILTGNADVFMVKYAERYIYRWLFKNKIEIYEYQKNVLHAKIAVCDGNWVTVGSYNVNNLSAFASIELNLDVNHPEFAQQTQTTLEKIMKEDCEKITEKKFNKQFNIISRAAHKGAYELFRFLFFLSIRQKGDQW